MLSNSLQTLNLVWNYQKLWFHNLRIKFIYLIDNLKWHTRGIFENPFHFLVIIRHFLNIELHIIDISLIHLFNTKSFFFLLTIYSIRFIFSPMTRHVFDFFKLWIYIVRLLTETYLSWLYFYAQWCGCIWNSMIGNVWRIECKCISCCKLNWF